MTQTLKKKKEEEDNEALEMDDVAGSTADNNKGGDAKKPRRTRKKWKKPKDKPNRPLSAYNLFFQKERARMLGDDASKPEIGKDNKRIHRKTHGKIGFAEMAKIIGSKWKNLPEEEKSEFQEVAAKEKERYAKELSEWNDEQKKKAVEQRRAARAEQKLAAKKKQERAAKEKEVEKKNQLLSPEEELKLRVQMRLLQRSGQQQRQQVSTINYLRAMQGDRASALGGMNSFATGLPQHAAQQRFPNASEASANALMNQFQRGMDVSGGSSDLERLQQLQLARMQMMNSMTMNSMLGTSPFNSSMLGGGMMGGSMMGSSMRGGSMNDSMRMGTSLSQQMTDLELQRYQQMRMIQGMNQMGGTSELMDRSDRSERGGPNLESMMRFHNRFNGM